MNLRHIVAAAALTCATLTGCATQAPENGDAVRAIPAADQAARPNPASCGAERQDASQTVPACTARTAGFAIAALFPSGFLDAALVTLTALSLGNQGERNDDFLSRFGRRILNGRTQN